MESCLTNVCEYDEKHLGEALRFQTRDTQSRKNLFLAVLLLGLLGFSLYQWFANKSSQYLLFALLSVAMGGMLAYTNLLLPLRFAKKQAERIREKNGGQCFRFLFREEGVATVGPTGEEAALTAYSAFRKLAETPELLILVTESRQMILLDRARFENGTEEDFRALLRERCPSVLPGA